MTEQAASFFELTPGDESPEFSASATFTIDVFDATTPNEALLEVTPQPGVSSAMGLSPPGDAGGSIPTPQPAQAWFVIRFAGVEHIIGEAPIDGGLPSVELALEGIAWTFGAPSRVGDNGRPWTLWESDLQGLAPPGIGELDIFARYRFDVGANEVLLDIPIVTGGRSWGSRRPLTGNPLLMQGKGRLSRYAPQKVTYLAKAGHGLTHGELARAILELSDLDPLLIEVDASIGEALTKRLEVDCSSPIDEASKVLESFGFKLIETTGGGATAKHMAPVDFQPVATLRVDRAEVETETATDWEGIPACLAIEGDRPVIPDLSDALVTTERIESFREELVTLPVAGFRQIPTGGSAGDFVATIGPPATEQFLRTEQITVRETTFQGCLQVKERLVEQFFNPEAWRFETALPASLDGLPYTYVTAYSFESTIPTKDDSSPVFVWQRPRFVPVSYEREEYFRDDEIVRDALGFPILDDDGLTQPIGRTGRLAKITKGTGRWRTREKALRDGATVGSVPDWSVITIISELRLLGGGTPVENHELFFMGPTIPDGVVSTEGGGGILGASFQALQSLQQQVNADGGSVFEDTWSEFTVEKISLKDIETPTSEDRPGGFETGRTVDNFGFQRSDGPFGGVFQFLNGETSGVDRLAARRTSRLGKTFVANGDGTHTSVTSSVDGEGRPGPIDTRLEPSHLPIADVCTQETVFEENSVTVRGIACLPEGLVVPVWTDTLRYDFGVETAAQADRLAEILLRRMTAIDVELTVPFNALLRVLDPIRLEAVGLGIDPDLYPHPSNSWIEDLSHLDERDDRGQLRRVTRILLSWAIL